MAVVNPAKFLHHFIDELHWPQAVEMYCIEMLLLTFFPLLMIHIVHMTVPTESDDSVAKFEN